MATFPWLNFVFVFFSTWVALSPRFRTSDVKQNWVIFYLNLFAVFINSIAVLSWIFTRITT